MGYFANVSAIRKINMLIQRIEPKLDYITDCLQYPALADRSRLRSECGTVSVLMDEIMSIVGESNSRAVLTAPYFLQGKKTNLMEISKTAAAILRLADKL